MASMGTKFVLSALLLAVMTMLVIDDVSGVTIVVRPSYRRIRIQGGPPSTPSTTSTSASSTEASTSPGTLPEVDTPTTTTITTKTSSAEVLERFGSPILLDVDDDSLRLQSITNDVLADTQREEEQEQNVDSVDEEAETEVPMTTERRTSTAELTTTDVESFNNALPESSSSPSTSSVLPMSSDSSSDHENLAEITEQQTTTTEPTLLFNELTTTEADDEPTTTIVFPIIEELNELVGPGREAKAIDSGSSEVQSVDNKEDVVRFKFDIADPFLSVMGAMLTPTTTISTTTSTSGAKTTTEKEIEHNMEGAETSENNPEMLSEISMTSTTIASAIKILQASQDEASSTSTISEPEASTKPPPIVEFEPPSTPSLPVDGDSWRNSPFKNLEARLGADRRLREEQEQALAFLRSIKTPLALSEASPGGRSRPKPFPPGDTATGPGEEDQLDERPAFFGGFINNRFPATLQAAGLSLPSQHDIGRPLFAARPFPGPLPPTLSGFPDVPLLPAPRPGSSNNNNNNNNNGDVDPFLAITPNRQRSAASKRSPPLPIVVFDSPRTGVRAQPFVSDPPVRFGNPRRNLFRREQHAAVAAATGAVASASSLGDGHGSGAIAAASSSGNPFLVRLPGDRGRAARRVVLQSHPDTEFVYTV